MISVDGGRWLVGDVEIESGGPSGLFSWSGHVENYDFYKLWHTTREPVRVLIANGTGVYMGLVLFTNHEIIGEVDKATRTISRFTGSGKLVRLSNKRIIELLLEAGV